MNLFNFHGFKIESIQTFRGIRMPPKFIFVRHAEATHNLDFRINGSEALCKEEHKDAPLTPKGKEQATAVGEALSSYNILDIWSSPLSRCVDTAIEILEESSAVHLRLHDALVERMGAGQVYNERLSVSDIKKKYEGVVDTTFLPELPAYWTDHEPWVAVCKRMQMFMLLLIHIYKDISENQYVVVVSHKQSIYSITQKEMKNAEFVIMTASEIQALP